MSHATSLGSAIWRTRFLTDRVSELIVVVGMDGRILTANQSACSTMGYCLDDLEGKSLSDVFVEKQWSELRLQLKLEQEFTESLVLRSSDGGIRPVEVAFTLLSEKDTTYCCIIATPVQLPGDIPVDNLVRPNWLGSTGQLYESREQLRSILDNHVDGAAVICDNRLVYVNDRCCELGRFDRQDILGQSPFEFLIEADKELARQRVKSVLATGTPSQSEYVGCKKDGGTVPVEITSRRITFDGGLAILVVLRDISERRDQEEKLVLLQEELTHVTRVSSMGEMATGIAHEINQPLTAIANFAGAAAVELSKSMELSKSLAASDSDDPMPAKLLKTFEQIEGQAFRAGEIIRSLRSFVQRNESHRVSLDINELICQVIRLLRADTRLHQIIVELKLRRELPNVIADRVQIQQVILNLVRNAFEATQHVDPPRTVTISTSRLGHGEVQASVADNGIGLPESDRDLAFEPFRTSKPDGLGMGLPISRSIVESHNGRLWAAPRQSTRTTFHLVLPAVPDDVSKSQCEVDNTNSPEQSHFQIDDDPSYEDC